MSKNLEALVLIYISSQADTRTGANVKGLMFNGFNHGHVDKTNLKHLLNGMKFARQVQGVPVRACLKDGVVGWFIAENESEADEHEQFTLDVLYGKGKFTVEQARAKMAEHRKEHPAMSWEDLEEWRRLREKPSK
jgi:hypothetical protein